MSCVTEIGLTTGTMFALTSIGVPNPDHVVFVPCANEKQCGDQTWQRSGYRTLAMTWLIMHEKEARRLLTAIFVTEATASSTLYLRTAITNGWQANVNKYRLFQVEFKAPNLGGEDGKPVDLMQDVYENLVLHSTLLAEVP